MKKHKLIPVLTLAFVLLLAAWPGIAKGAANEVKVQIHIVEGSGITEAQVRAWLKRANEIDAGKAKHVEDSNHYHSDPNTDPNDPNNNDPNRINIWAVPKCKVTGEPNNVSGRKGTLVELVDPNATKDPNDANAPDVYIKDSTLAHELNHIHKLKHVKDPNNKMHPDNQPDANGVLKSCHRKGTEVTAWQLDKIGEAVRVHEAIYRGYGGDVYDSVGDVPPGFGYIDLDWAQGWMEWAGGTYVLHLTAQVQFLSLSYSEIGFYIESDNNPFTGEPPEGLDYYMFYYPFSGEVNLWMYETGYGWIPLDPCGITREITETSKDANIPPVPSGVKFELPLEKLERRAGDVISHRAVAQNEVEMDIAPDVGLLSIPYPPQWPPDFVPDGVIDYKDLDVLSDEWLASPPADGDVDLYYDGQIDFKDFAEFGRYWGQYQP